MRRRFGSGAGASRSGGPALRFREIERLRHYPRVLASLSGRLRLQVLELPRHGVDLTEDDDLVRGIGAPEQLRAPQPRRAARLRALVPGAPPLGIVAESVAGNDKWHGTSPRCWIALAARSVGSSSRPAARRRRARQSGWPPRS